MWPRIVGVGGNNASLFPLQVVYGEDVKVVLRGIEGIEGQSRVESVAHGRVIMAEAAPPHAVVSVAWMCGFVAIHCLCIRNCLAFHNLGFRQPICNYLYFIWHTRSHVVNIAAKALA